MKVAESKVFGASDALAALESLFVQDGQKLRVNRKFVFNKQSQSCFVTFEPH